MGRRPSPNQIINVWHKALERGFVRPNGFVHNPAGIVKLIAQLYSVRRRADAVVHGTFPANTTDDYIARLTRGALTHFVIVRNTKHGVRVVYDPKGAYDGAPSYVLRNGKFDTSRLFK